MTDSIPFTPSIHQLKGFLQTKPKDKNEALAIVFENKEWKHIFNRFLVLNEIGAVTNQQRIGWYLFSERNGKFVLFGSGSTPFLVLDTLGELLLQCQAFFGTAKTCVSLTDSNYEFVSQEETSSSLFQQNDVAGLSRFDLQKAYIETLIQPSSWSSFKLKKSSTSTLSEPDFQTAFNQVFGFQCADAKGGIFYEWNPKTGSAFDFSKIQPDYVSKESFLFDGFNITSQETQIKVNDSSLSGVSSSYRSLSLYAFLEQSHLRLTSSEEKREYEKIAKISVGMNVIMEDVKPWRAFIWSVSNSNKYIVFKAQTSTKDVSVHCLRFFGLQAGDKFNKRRFVLQQDLMRCAVGHIPYVKTLGQLLDKVRKLYSQDVNAKYFQKELRWMDQEEMNQLIVYSCHPQHFQVERPSIALRDSKKRDLLFDGISSHFVFSKVAATTQAQFLRQTERSLLASTIRAHPEMEQILLQFGDLEPDLDRNGVSSIFHNDKHSFLALYILSDIHSDACKYIRFEKESLILSELVRQMNFQTSNGRVAQKTYLSPEFNDSTFVPFTTSSSEVETTLQLILKANEEIRGVFGFYFTADCIAKPFDMIRVLDVSKQATVNLLQSVSSEDTHTKNCILYQMGPYLILLSASKESAGIVLNESSGDFLSLYSSSDLKRLYQDFFLGHLPTWNKKITTSDSSSLSQVLKNDASFLYGFSETRVFDFLQNMQEYTGDVNLFVQLPTLHTSIKDIYFLRMVDGSSSGVSLFSSSTVVSGTAFLFPVVVHFPVRKVLDQYQIDLEGIQVYKKYSSKKHHAKWEEWVGLSHYLEGPHEQVSPSHIFKTRLTSLESAWKKMSSSILLEADDFQKAFQTTHKRREASVVELLKVFGVQPTSQDKLQSVWKQFVQKQKEIL